MPIVTGEWKHFECGCEIEPQILYSIPDIERRLGWKKAAMRTAREQGLPVRYLAGRGYVLGADLIAHVLQHGKDSK